LCVIALPFLMAIPASAVAQIGIPAPKITGEVINLKAKARLEQDSTTTDCGPRKVILTTNEAVSNKSRNVVSNYYRS
jgi:hypothetical protein